MLTGLTIGSHPSSLDGLRTTPPVDPYGDTPRPGSGSGSAAAPGAGWAVDPGADPGLVAGDDAGADEAARLAVLHSYGILDADTRLVFDSFTELAADLCRTPIATISLVDESRLWFLAGVGLPVCETSRQDSFCAHAVNQLAPLVVPDAHGDARFAHNPMVTGPPWIRFYAGAPLITAAGLIVGTLCVMDTESRHIAPRQRRQLTLLAAQVTAQLTAHRQAGQLAAEIAARRAIEARLEANERLFRGVLSHPDAVVYAKDLDGRYVLANDALHAVLQLDRNTLVGRTDHQVMAAAAADAFRANDLRVLQSRQRVVVEERFPAFDGSVRHFSSTRFPLWDDTGTVYGVAGVSVDVTMQRAAHDELRKSERRWRQLFDASPVGVYLSDQHGVIIEANAELCALLGRPRAEVVGHNTIEFTHLDDLLEHRSSRSLLSGAGAEICELERRFVRPNGDVRWAWLAVGTTPGPDGAPWTLAHVQDISERLASERAVRDSQANLSAVASVVAQIQSGGDARQTIVTACAELAAAQSVWLLESGRSGRGLRVTAMSPGARPDAVAVGPDSPAGRATRTGAAVFVSNAVLGRARPGGTAGAGYAVPIRVGDARNAVLIASWTDPVADVDDRRTDVVRLLADQAGVALRQSALVGELQRLAVTDALTGLPNRRGWNRALSDMVATRRLTDRLVVALIDIDHFKVFNDTRGHTAGDELLRDFGSRARSMLRAGDMLARWGGEEFALALPNCQGTDVDVVIARICEAMPEAQTCSAGYAEVGFGQDLGQAMIEADTALYVAKNNGRNQIRSFELPE